MANTYYSKIRIEKQLMEVRANSASEAKKIIEAQFTGKVTFINGPVTKRANFDPVPNWYK